MGCCSDRDNGVARFGGMVGCCSDRDNTLPRCGGMVGCCSDRDDAVARCGVVVAEVTRLTCGIMVVGVAWCCGCIR